MRAATVLRAQFPIGRSKKSLLVRSFTRKHDKHHPISILLRYKSAPWCVLKRQVVDAGVLSLLRWFAPQAEGLHRLQALPMPDLSIWQNQFQLLWSRSRCLIVIETTNNLAPRLNKAYLESVKQEQIITSKTNALKYVFKKTGRDLQSFWKKPIWNLEDFGWSSNCSTANLWATSLRVVHSESEKHWT